MGQCKAGKDGKYGATNRTFPRLLGRDAFEQAMLAKQHSCTVSGCIVYPIEDEYGEGQDIYILGYGYFHVVLESLHVKQGKRKTYIQLAHHGIGPIVDGVLLLQVQLADQQVYQ